MINPCSRCQKLTEAISRNLGKFLGDSKDGVLHIFTQQSSQHMRYCKGEGDCDMTSITAKRQRDQPIQDLCLQAP